MSLGEIDSETHTEPSLGRPRSAQLDLEDLVLDPTLMLRDQLDEEVLQRYADGFALLPPITVFEVDEQRLIVDGFHRHAAAVQIGCSQILAEVYQGTQRDALDYVASANLFHGLPLNRAERRRAIELKLRLFPEWSDRRVADELGVSRDTVGRVRKSLVEGHQIPDSNTRVGTDGKLYSLGLPRDPELEAPSKSSQSDRPSAPEDQGDSVTPWSQERENEAGSRPRKNREPGSESAQPNRPDPGDHKAMALADPPKPAAPTIDEMLAIMTDQILEVVGWMQGEGFEEAYDEAKEQTRRNFQRAVEELGSLANHLEPQAAS